MLTNTITLNKGRHAPKHTRNIENGTPTQGSNTVALLYLLLFLQLSEFNRLNSKLVSELMITFMKILT